MTMILHLRPVKFAVSGCTALLILGAWKITYHHLEATTLFDAIRPSYELVEFIAESAFVDNYRTVHDSLVDDLDKKRIHLLFSTSSTITVGTEEYPLPNRQQALHFASRDDSYWIDIVQHDDGELLFADWQNAKRTLGIKSEIENGIGGSSVFLRVETTGNSALGALFYTGRNLFNVGISLPFPVLQYDKLDAAQQLTVRNKFKELYSILEAISRRYVAPPEFVSFPRQGKRLTRDQRLYGLIQFWTEVKYNFAFFDQVPNLNWDYTLAEYLPIIAEDQTDEAYYRHLQKLCALLEDGHTNVYLPAAVEATLDYPPVSLTNIQQKAIVENVAVSWQRAIPVGSEVVSVEDIPTQVYLRDSIFPYISASTEYILSDWGIQDLLKGKKGTSVTIGIKQPGGEEKQVVLERNRQQVAWVKQNAPWSLLTFKRLPDDIAYVALNSFGSDEIVQEFENQLDTITSCQGLIIDVRANGGGNSGNAYEIVKHLTNTPFLTSQWQTREHRAAFKAWGKNANESYRERAKKKKQERNEWDEMLEAYYQGNRWYTEAADTIVPPPTQKINLPVVVLVGHNTASAAEDFLIALDQVKGVTLVGERTFGSTGQPLPLPLPGGGSARICTKRDTYPDGKEFVGYGIEPDVYVENTVESLLQGSDPALTKGTNILTNSQK